MDDIILVDENDRQIGTGEKMEVHKNNRLHRAFSIFVFNDKNDLMLQKRAGHKYHSGGLWTNTCCSHPHPGESVIDSAHARLQNEMGFDIDLTEKFTFQYTTQYEGIAENEIDHVLFGHYNGEPEINLDEAEDWRWVSLTDLRKEIRENPEGYTSWLKIAIEKISSPS